MIGRVLGPAGDWLRDHQGWIRRGQWLVVGLYLVLVAVPAFLPLPPRTAHLWDDLTLAAQFAFWGVWWPFVLISMVVLGRSWCGFFCPEGTLTEWASGFGRGRAVPRWLTWRGWPFVAFACTTVYGQMVSVYQYPKPVLLVLGGSTAAAVATGLMFGRNKRVWCRYLCPANGVFGLLAKLAPLHYRVDRQAWAAAQQRHERPAHPVNCAPLVPIRTMTGASQCHMCGRCSGFRDAVSLSARSPDAEIVGGADQPDRWDTVLIFYGMMGIAVGAFHWSASPWFVALKQAAAEFLVDHGVLWPLEATAPWWILTDYPGQNDVLTLLDGAVMLAYILATAAALGTLLAALTAAASALLGGWSWRRFHHLAHSLIPLAGCGVFLGLSALTVSLLRGEGVALPWINLLRLLFLAGACGWSWRLAWRIAGRYATGGRRAAGVACMGAATAVGAAGWIALFWLW